MPDIQGGYPANIDAARVGMIANTLDSDIISGSCEVADVPFGVAVIQGAAADGFTLGAAGFFRGITVRDTTLPPQNADKYQVGSGISAMTRGPIWVTTLAACVAGNPVYRNAAGALTPTAAGSTLIERCYFETAAAANGLARIRLH